MSKWIVDIHGDIEGDYEIIEEYKEPKTGRWIDMDEGFSPCECSECGNVEFNKTNYCPNCGVKMVEPQESEKYCDRNICISNEYSGIGCDECEVTKSHKNKIFGKEEESEE